MLKTIGLVAMCAMFCGLILLAAGSLAGCGSSEATHRKATKIADTAAVADAKAEANPMAHPVRSAEVAVKKLRAPLGIICLGAFVSLAVSIGLLWTPLSVISKTAVPVCGSVTVVSLFGLIALPFFPWILLALAAGAIGLFVYEVIRARSLAGGVMAIESDLEQLAGTVPAKAAATIATPAAAN